MMLPSRHHHTLLWLLISLCAFCYIYLLTFGHGIHGPVLSPVLWMIAGLCLVGLVLFGRPSGWVASIQHGLLDTWVWGLCILFWCGVGYFVFRRLDQIFTAYPIDVKQSDVIPSLSMYVQRAISWSSVYEPMHFDGYTIIPTYFPMTWLPFVLPEIVGLDYRWWAAAAMWVALTLVSIWLWRRSDQLVPNMAVTTLMAYAFYAMTGGTPHFMYFAIELMPATFYLLLGCALIRGQAHWIGLALFACMYSRYSLVFFVPFLLILIWQWRGFRFLLKVGLYACIPGLLLWLIPHIGFGPEEALAGVKNYSRNAASKWLPFGWQPEGELPYHLKRGYGLALVFYKYYQPDIDAGIAFMRSCQLVCSLIIGTIMMLFYWLCRPSSRATPTFIIAWLLIYMTVFYSLLFIPYDYLYQVPLTMIIPLLIAYTLQVRRSDKMNTTDVSPS